MAAEDIKKRIEMKRWELYARSERARAIAAFPEFAQTRNFTWYGFEKSLELQLRCSVLGKEPGRIIQRWDDQTPLIGIAENLAPKDMEGDCNLLPMDYSKAGWLQASMADIFTVLMHSLPKMTDGFILYRSPSQSILSVDVETRNESRWIETTLIGNGFETVGLALINCPDPLSIFPPGRGS